MENSALYNVWKKMYEDAKEKMAGRKMNGGVLIEVAAQHPLINGEMPNEEFEKRLLLAAELYREYAIGGNKVKIYVPGSLHKFKGVVDKIPLSEAGKAYLLQKGIADSDIFADNMNKKYKGSDGVYNSADECFVSGKIFDELNYGELHCVCSSGQMMRKMLCYIHFGYVPYMHTVSCDVMYHDYIDEIFKFIPILLKDGCALQGETEEADRLRNLRKP